MNTESFHKNAIERMTFLYRSFHYSAVLQRFQIEAFHWDNVPIITILVLYCITQFMFFSLVPVILFESGATALQLALLTSDSFNILAGMLNHHYKVLIRITSIRSIAFSFLVSLHIKYIKRHWYLNYPVRPKNWSRGNVIFPNKNKIFSK